MCCVLNKKSMPTQISENFLFKYLELYHMNAEKVDLSQKSPQHTCF